jgi:hypothetical protein
LWVLLPGGRLKVESELKFQIWLNFRGHGSGDQLNLPYSGAVVV